VTRTVTVGTAADLDVRAVVTAAPTWCGPAPALPLAACAQLRAHGDAVGARVEAADGGGLRLLLDSPVRGVAAGQTAALYAGDRVLGSATIEQAAPGSVGAATG
jgi:tRNA-specific 2-thiouridylase